MQKLFKYFFALIVAVAFAACSSDDEPATGPEYMPQLNGEINYEFLTNLTTSTGSRLFELSHAWFYSRQYGESNWRTPSTTLVGGYFSSHPEYYFHQGNVYHDDFLTDSNPENYKAHMLGYVSQLYKKHYGEDCNLWIKSKFEFHIGKRTLLIDDFGKSCEYEIENTGISSFTISYSNIQNESLEFYHVGEFIENTNPQNTKNSHFFNSLKELVNNILEKEEAGAGETDLTKKIRYRLEIGLYDDLSAYYENPEKWWKELTDRMP